LLVSPHTRGDDTNCYLRSRTARRESGPEAVPCYPLNKLVRVGKCFIVFQDCLIPIVPGHGVVSALNVFLHVLSPVGGLRKSITTLVRSEMALRSAAQSAHTSTRSLSARISKPTPPWATEESVIEFSGHLFS